MKVKLITAALIAVSLLSGCASNSYTDAPPTLGVMYSKYAYLGYSGDPQPIENVGIVTTDGLIKIKQIDGDAIEQFQVYKTSGLYSGGRFQLHLLPGNHTLTMGFHDDRGSGTIAWSTMDVTKTFTIEKGQILHISVVNQGRHWDANVTEGAKDRAAIESDFASLSKK